MDLTTLPVIDWELGEKRAGSRQWAEEILVLLMQRLPDDIAQIHQAYAEQKYNELLNHVHKLHGAIAYCGLPRLKLVITSIESHLRSHIMDGLPSQLEQLDSEVNLLLQEEISPTSLP